MSKTILMVLAFVLGVVLVIVGQRTVGYPYLAVQIFGLALILYVVNVYNKRYQ